MTTKPPALTLDTNEKAFALAVTVIEDRMRQLPKEDRDDLFALLPAICGDDEEEKQSALAAAQEILNQTPAQVAKMAIPPSPAASLSNWLGYISARIRTAREDAGLTQTDLANKTGLQQAHISRLEKGEHSPTNKTLLKIAKALDLEVDYFDLSTSQERS